MAKHKAVKKRVSKKVPAKPAVRKAVPYDQIAAMWVEGKSYQEIATRIGRFKEGTDDPTKPTRAIVSNMLRLGYRNGKGDLVKLPVRKQMRNVGVAKIKALKAAGNGKGKTPKASK